MGFFDTNILIDALVGHTQAVAELGRAQSAQISRITWIEVLAGAEDEAEEQRLESFLAKFNVVEITEAIARRAARLRRTARWKMPDALVYAAAQQSGEELITRNTKDFPRGTTGVRVPYSL